MTTTITPFRARVLHELVRGAEWYAGENIWQTSGCPGIGSVAYTNIMAMRDAGWIARDATAKRWRITDAGRAVLGVFDERERRARARRLTRYHGVA
jgi:hypothetical protein